jgi:hypothetical protein
MFKIGLIKNTSLKNGCDTALQYFSFFFMLCINELVERELYSHPSNKGILYGIRIHLKEIILVKARQVSIH